MQDVRPWAELYAAPTPFITLPCTSPDSCTISNSDYRHNQHPVQYSRPFGGALPDRHLFCHGQAPTSRTCYDYIVLALPGSEGNFRENRQSTYVRVKRTISSNGDTKRITAATGTVSKRYIWRSIGWIFPGSTDYTSCGTCAETWKH